MADKYTIEIKKRTWWEWLITAIWVFAEIFILQNAIMSSGELEPRAASIFWVMFFVLLVAGVVIWYLRKEK
ncbi:MAG: hypothetical protein PVF83_12210 [Anaerolineales bacterium]|jgi:hypothetical protein